MSTMMEWNAIAIDASDSVAVALTHLRPGDDVQANVGGTIRRLTVAGEVPLGHKIALVAIKSGTPVTKYGAVIASATRDISPGDHVHVHNIASNRVRRDAR